MQRPWFFYLRQLRTLSDVHFVTSYKTVCVPFTLFMKCRVTGVLVALQTPVESEERSADCPLQNAVCES